LTVLCRSAQTRL